MRTQWGRRPGDGKSPGLKRRVLALWPCLVAAPALASVPAFDVRPAQPWLLTRSERSVQGDAVKTWTGTAGNTLWSSAGNWTPAGVPVPGDTLTFPTLSSDYNVTNDLPLAGPTYALVVLDGTSAGHPRFGGGFNTNELLALSLGHSTWTAGTYQVVGRSTFRGQSVTTLQTDAALLSDTEDHALYLWEQANLSVSQGASVDFSGSESLIAIDDSASLDVQDGSVHAMNALVGNDSIPGNRAVSVSGANGSLRIDFQTLVHTSGFGSPAGTANFDLSNGGHFSSGIMEVNVNPTAPGLSADTNISVDDATFEISNAVGFENSYFAAGMATGPGTTTISLTNGGQFRVSDTDGTGQAFAVFSNAYRADTAITLGGRNGAGAQSTMRIDGLMFAAPAVGRATDTLTTTLSIHVNADGRLIVRDASIFSCDAGYESTLRVTEGGYADLGLRAIFSGGSADLATSRGAGTSLVSAVGGELRAGSFELMGDPHAAPNTAGWCELGVSGASGRIIAYGVDDPGTPGIDSGFFAASRGNGEAGSDLATGGTVTVNATGGGLIEAGEAFFAGDMQSGVFTVHIAGSNSLLDAGGLFEANSRGLFDSDVAITIDAGGRLLASSSSSGATGHIRLNPVAGSGAVSVTLTSGGTLESHGSIHLGGERVQTAPGVYLHTVGSTTTVDGSSGNILAGAEVYLASGSTLSSGRFVAENVFIDGEWTIISGGLDRRVRTGDLVVGDAGSVRVQPQPPGAPTLIVTADFSLGSQSQFDLSNNALLIRPTSASTSLETVKQLLANGRTGLGAGGISSSMPTPSTALGYRMVGAAGTFLGEPVLSGDLLVRFTLKGDADLNGEVDFDDLLVLAQHYSASGEWFTGDFTFDGNVNFDDLLALAQNYSSSLGNDDAHLGADWALARSLVPEPMATVPLLVGLAVARRRRDI